ncbi:cytidine deaminase [Parasphingopyxis lamellibrachiae]|uniref:Cytidine deaminase n=1 Tax=Parasphingopyxis lamellibrachiae TaxID=680125 RepID=A0A3D9FFM2_9SPHN|nr:cytidine deaminase [Parasphingopyxis lamellibrachiae]RED16630.1 cytidine deaminase [Parasphingopyxis lamellibrachiae]
MAQKSHTAAQLVSLARAAAAQAHAPYSGFSVGCAIEAEDGRIAVGSNMENACYRLGTCAEISALTSAQQTFGLGNVRRIAVAGGHIGDDGALAGTQAVLPCGGCRQAIAEARDLSGVDIEIVASSGDGGAISTHRISALLPASFGTDNLDDAKN